MMWIFLDIDGVLVPENKFDQFVSRENLMKFDPICLMEFENVLRLYPDVLVVISSSWREVFSFEAVRPLFSPDIAGRVMGFTPFLDSKVVHQSKYLRHQEVLEYLRQNDALEMPWVAIDDIPEHYPPDTRIVVTDASVGFNQFAALALEEYLRAI
jgi:hypothetical protein